MDTSDVEIHFDVAGVCNHCHEFDETAASTWFPNREGAGRLARMIEQIKADGKGKRYDCIIGLSGGADSSYLAMKAAEWGLSPLIVHVDAGWNSELAVSNIERVIKSKQYDLVTNVIDWEEMRDLQLAYLRAGVSNQDTPQDHAFFASVSLYASKHNIKHILSGGNFATESVLPRSWQGSAMDAINLRAIHARFGERKLVSYQTISLFRYYVFHPVIKGMRMWRPLNLMPYDKSAAHTELSEKTGWRPYDRKHGESLFTKVFQNDFLPRRFNFDKRRAHLSSLVLANQTTRDAALTKLGQPLYEPDELEIDLAFLCKKLRISRDEYEAFISAPLASHRDFPNWERKRLALHKARQFVASTFGYAVPGYSKT
jgi:aminotransferase